MMQKQTKGAWCLILVANNKVRAKITHVGQGKFKVLEDESGNHSGLEIDASDIFHCRE